MSIRIIRADVLAGLAELPDESVHCVVTSPPYWGLRDYGVAGQIGLEPTPDAFVARMVEVFREVRRVLRGDGTCWVNLGDAYAGSWGAQSRGGPPSDKSTLSGNGHVGGGPKLKTLSGVQIAAAQHHEAGTGSLKRTPGLKPKDLIGIPWRVAFALQAPGYLGAIRNEVDRAWLAGLTDGEGCITILEATSPHGSGSSYPPILQVRMCDRECIDKAMRITSTGGDSPAQYPASMEGQRPAYQWRIHGRKAAATIAEIYPFLLIKRKQAIVAWNHQVVRDGYETKRGVKIPADALEKQKLCRDLIQRLNKREPVDIPSWMMEPPLPVGPGWYLRSDVIWSKPNPMPESVTDRPTKAHEYLFLLTKAERYYYDAEAIKEAQAESGIERAKYARVGHAKDVYGDGITNLRNPRTDATSREREMLGLGRNKRTVWTIATAPFPEAHFATFPPELPETCIKAGCPVGGTVLDPFAGAGTTLLVADRLQRNAIGIELNPEYAAMAERRVRNDGPLFADVS